MAQEALDAAQAAYDASAPVLAAQYAAALKAYTDASKKSDDAAKKVTDDLLWHVEQARYQAQLDWIAAARKAMDKNRVTFAVLNLPEVLSPDGHLAKLRELGYTVDEPL